MRMVVAGAVCAALLWVGFKATPAVAQAPSFSFVVPEEGGSTIGVNIDDVSTEEAGRAKLRQPEGALVRNVQDGSPASKAGIRSGDVIVEFDGERVRSAKQLQRLVQETPAERTVKTTVVREGARQTLDITPQERSQEPGGDPRRPFTLPNLRMGPGQPQGLRDLLQPQQGRLGAVIRGLDGQLATYFGVKSGALVESVSPGSPADAAGLKAGDVITRINGRDVTAPEQVTSAVRDVQPGAPLALTVLRDKKTVELKTTMPAEEKPEAPSDRIRL